MDEADRILNMDFEVEVDKILGCLPKEGRRNMLFSATMTKKVAKLQRASLSGLVTHYFSVSSLLSRIIVKIWVFTNNIIKVCGSRFNGVLDPLRQAWDNLTLLIHK